MGALASIRSRDTNSPDFQVSKKRRYSFMSRIGKETVDSTNSTVSRISQYPETSSKIHREVHAPCRTSKFGLGRSKPLNSRRESFTAAGDDMGSYLSKKLDLAKTRAMHALRFLPVRKDIVKEDEDKDEEEDSVREGVVIEDDGKEGRSIVLLDDDENEGETDRGNEDVRYDKNLVENAGKMLGSLELNQDVDASNVQVYKKLLEDVERRSGRKLKDLKFEIELNERKRSSFKSLRSVKKPEKSVEEDHSEPFIPLTEEEKAEVDHAVLPSNRKTLFVSHSSGIDITGEILRCLLPGAWLNDEVINLYLELLKEREKREPQKYLKCHFFSTFFYKKLVGAQKVYDYKAVRRWTTERKLGYFLIDCDKIFVPVHREIHWCLAIINKKDQKFQYLDSLKGRDLKVLKNLAKYYVEEVKEKSKIDIDVSDWEHEFVEDLPEQQNGYDCGMFMLKYIDFYSRGLGLCFGQEHMPYFRLRTAKEILRLRAD